MNGAGATRFGGGVTTLSRRTRLVLTVPLVLWDLFLAVQIVLWSFDDDPRVAALLLLVLGFSGLYTVVLLRGVWRSSSEWVQERNRLEAERRRIQRIVKEPHQSDRF